MFEIFQYDFIVNAVIASVLASIAFGIVGTYVVVKKIVFVSGGISHTAYGGIGLGYLLGINPMIGAIAFTVGSASFISLMRRNKGEQEDTLIGIMWAFGMALGVIFIGFTPGYTPNLMSYLFGNILTIPSSELVIMGILDFFILLFVIVFYSEFQAVTFDEEFARSIGLPVERIFFMLLLIIALTVVVLIKLVGIILVVALLSIPSAIALRFADSLKKMMIISVCLGTLFTLVGLFLSYYLNLASGATIIVFAVIVYMVSFLKPRLKN